MSSPTSDQSARLRNQVLSVSQMRAAEQALIDAGTSVGDLMERAGRGAAQWVHRIAAGRNVTVLCGPGNNGGDGYVIARRLSEAGLTVKVVAPGEPQSSAAKDARSRWAGDVSLTSDGVRGGVFVDCLFGSGLSRPIADEQLSILRNLAARHDTCVAIDLPSGLACDSGAVLNEGLPCYDVTLALGGWKFAHWSLPARALMGERRLVPISVEPVNAAAQLIDRPNLARPADDAHKYTRGLAAIVGGSMPGAAILAAMAAQRAGAGYVRLLSSHSHPAAPADLVLDDAPLGEALADERIDAVLAGPGLGRTEDARERLAQVLAADIPLMLDADALVMLEPEMLGKRRSILATPHDGELKTLCRNFSITAEGRREQVSALASASGMVVCAKGPDTIVAAPDGRLALAPPAPSWLSTAGTGDVLAGIAVSRMATGAEPFDAACHAVWLHAQAARDCGPAFTASDLAAAVSGTVASCL